MIKRRIDYLKSVTTALGETEAVIAEQLKGRTIDNRSQVSREANRNS